MNGVNQTIKTIKEGEDARATLKKGVDKAVDIAQSTYGPYGRNVLVDNGFTFFITNDGVTILNYIEFQDEIENKGAQFIASIARQVDREVGDNTTVSAIMARTLIGECFDTKDPIGKYKEIKEEYKKVEALVKEKAKAVKTNEDLRNVAFVASESEELSKIIGDTYKKLGSDAIVTVIDGNTTETEVEISEGIEVNGGVVSYYMLNNMDKGTVEMSNIPVLVTDRTVETIKDISNIMDTLLEDGKTSMILIANKIEQNALVNFIQNKAQGIFNLIAIEIKDIELLKDIALTTGATLVDDTQGHLNKLGIEALGEIKRIDATLEKATIIGSKDVKEKIKELKKLPEDDIILERIARLTNKVATIKIGAVAEDEKKYLIDKAEDAKNTTKWALKEGVVKGGGVTFKEIAEELPDGVLTETLKAPYKQLQKNAGRTLEIDDNIIDSAHTLLTALKIVCSQVGIFITTHAVIANKKEDGKQ